MLGKVTRQKVCQPLAPSTRAASSSLRPCACMSGINSRATNGNVTKIVARTIPGAGAGETIYWVKGKEASFPFGPAEVVADTTVVGIVDSIHVAKAAAVKAAPAKAVPAKAVAAVAPRPGRASAARKGR